MARFISYPDDRDAANPDGDERWAYGGLELTDSFDWSVSWVGSARFRFNKTAGHLEYSENGGAWSSITGLASLIWTRTGTVVSPTVATDSVAISGKLTTPDSITLSPLSGGADNGPQITAAMATYKHTNLGPGIYAVNTRITPASGSSFHGSPGATIVQTIAGAGPDKALFYADIGALGALDTLNGAVNRGARSMVTTTSAPFAVGTIVQISNPGSSGNTAGMRVSTHTITAVAGVNANIEPPLPRNYPTASNVRAIASQPHDITIDGGGMTITGTGVRIAELKGAARCVVKNINVTDASGVPTDLLFSFDGASSDCHYENCHITITTAATPLAGFAFESATGCTGRNCTVNGGCAYGFIDYDGSDNSWLNCHAYYTPAAAGFAWGSDTAVHDATTEGCVCCSAIGCSALRCSIGFLVRDGSLDIRIAESSADGNATYGIQVGDGVTVPDGTQIESCSTTYNATAGLYLTALPVRTKVRGLDCSYNGTAAGNGTGIDTNAALDADDVTSRGGNGLLLLYAHTGGVVRVSRLSAVHTQNVNVVWFDAACSWASLTDSDLTIAAGANGVHPACNCLISNTKITGGAVGINTAGNTTHVGDNVDLSGCAAAFLLSAGVIDVTQAGHYSADVAAGHVALTFSQGRSSVLTATGASGASRNLVVLTVAGMAWDVYNASNNDLVVKTAAGSGVTIATTKTARVWCDGVNIARVTADT